MKSTKFLLPLAALALSGAAAAGSPLTESVVVRYGDLDLNSRAGVVGLHKRIHNAAESVCGNLSSRVMGLREVYDECVKEAVDNSIAAVGNLNLTNFHANRGKVAVLASAD
ncbi:MAG TPA: UrcA family protein [Steroidobacteraceae bacterium]|jgi:UrcA family protein|nr:UrcA family protein [Steroidobacteraceae bacterium]